MSACNKCGKMFEPASFQLDCDECGIALAQELMSKNNWEVSQETIDASDNLRRQNAINVSKLKDMPND